MATTADVVVIGGGITGTSAAYRLAQRGVNVLLVEKRFLGAGSTGKSSAIIRQHYSNEITARMALHSLRVFQNLADTVGGEAGFVQTGFAVLVEAKDRVGLEENVKMQQGLGVKTSVVSPDELRAIDPYLAVGETFAAAYEPEGGYADPAATVMSFGEAAKRHGAQIWQETRVTKVLLQNGRVAGVETTRGEISAPGVVNCGNAWAPQIAATVDVSLPIRPERHQVATFQRSPDMERSHLTAGDFVNNIYYRPEGARLTLVGSIDPNHGQEIDPDRYNEAADYAFIEDSAQRIGRRYPAMERSWSKGGWSGIYGVTPDWHPIIDEIPTGSGFFVAAGFSGHGFKLGPAVGLMIADMVTRATEPAAGFDRSLFRYARFAEGKPVTGKYEYGIVG